MIIDCNVHPTADGKWFHTSLDASLDSLLLQLDEAKVDKAVIIPFEGYISNEFSESTSARYPDRFISGVSVNPVKYKDAEDAYVNFERDFSNIVAPVLKLHNRIHGFDLLDERVLAILKANETFQKPLTVFICGLLISKNTPVQMSPPLIFQKIVSGFPKTNFVIMHCGMSWALQVFEAIKDCANAYMDLSYVQSKYKETSVWTDLKYLCKNYDRRIIFGSDFPEVNIIQATKDFNELTSGLDSIKIENIAGKNLLAILGA